MLEPVAQVACQPNVQSISAKLVSRTCERGSGACSDAVLQLEMNQFGSGDASL